MPSTVYRKESLKNGGHGEKKVSARATLIDKRRNRAPSKSPHKEGVTGGRSEHLGGKASRLYLECPQNLLGGTRKDGAKTFHCSQTRWRSSGQNKTGGDRDGTKKRKTKYKSWKPHRVCHQKVSPGAGWRKMLTLARCRAP